MLLTYYYQVNLNKKNFWVKSPVTIKNEEKSCFNNRKIDAKVCFVQLNSSTLFLCAAVHCTAIFIFRFIAAANYPSFFRLFLSVFIFSGICPQQQQ